MRMSSYLQFGSPSVRAGMSGKSPIAQSVGLQTAVSRVHQERVERQQLYLNMLKYKNKKRGI